MAAPKGLPRRPCIARRADSSSSGHAPMEIGKLKQPGQGDLPTQHIASRSVVGRGLRQALSKADVIVHLARVNRPDRPEELEAGNAGLTSHLCDVLREIGGAPQLVMSSSVQAALDNPCGVSKPTFYREVSHG